MDKDDSLIFLSLMCLFIIMTGLCSCFDRLINKSTKVEVLPPKYEEICNNI